jgi:glutathionylspermidine synthase
MSALSTAVIRHRLQRESFFARHAARWPGTLLDPYDLLDFTILDPQQAREISNAAFALWNVYQRMLVLLQSASDQALRAIGIPSDDICLARTSIPGMANPMLGRFDFAITPEGCKMLEFNVDAPGLIVEAFSINGAVCREAGRVDPNAEGEAKLGAALSANIREGCIYVECGNCDGKTVAVIAGRQYTRDLDAARYIWKLLQHQEGISCSLESVESLEADEEGIFNSDGKRIDVLVRMYGIMYLCRRAIRLRGKDAAYMSSEDLRRLIECKKIAVINLPSAYLLESKAVQALIWAFYEDNLFFTSAEREVIGRHMLPTYLDRPAGMRCAVKPAFGSNGDAILVDGEAEWGSSVIAEHPSCFDVFQKYVELPEQPFVTEDGKKILKTVTSCFVLAGRSIGLTLRAGQGITDVSWWVVPVCF